MWLPNVDESVLWMNSELVLDQSDILVKINNYINIKKWHNEYELLYRNWMNYDSPDLYSIRNTLHLKVIDEIVKINSQSNEFKLFYWFDVDRSLEENENFVWSTCPLSGKPLTRIELTHPNNRFISNEFPLVFPE